MSRLLPTKALLSGGILAILSALMTMLSGAASATVRSSSDSAATVLSQGLVSERVHASPLCAPEDLTEWMAAGGRAGTETAGCFLNPLHLQSGTTENRVRARGGAGFAPACWQLLGGRCLALCASPSRVSSALGRMQTLIGAKPSGTS